ncbi:hypothetical protein I3843_01G210500 [Carya illinoinensis]|uniref:Uncharacterized protein n=1 Tax=Carya illinoinensis TaxID=32201 RepID=A0A8T1RQR4_CARIL|nr:formin-like protein 14 [Carya illinoinensis]KAG2728665.1 hypothetical protein I3760_01G215500 [Carya illinoinensis]KAG6669088.1 hypothetical protein CIPAW_01G218600 [Carya illinoinensis]KAG6733300.1 hypothetical protein I3842_01G219500 [Carya illinoinensis]KAG7997425.1 hypothetical protein I3843_01G210500 [Carya illinoinensis]
MEIPLSVLVFQIFGSAISILALLAESHPQNDVNIPAIRSLVSRMSPPPPSPHLPILPTSVSNNRSKPPAPLPPPPYPRLRPPSPPPQDRWWRKDNKGSNYRQRKLPPLPPKKTINTGKKIGLLFVVIAAILQIGVVGFLAFKRRQLLKLRDSYETSS